MLGAFTYGWFAGVNAAQYVNAIEDSELNQSEIEAEKARIFAPLDCSEGLPPEQVEYKLRRFVNDYLQPPKTRQKWKLGSNVLKKSNRILSEFLQETRMS